MKSLTFDLQALGALGYELFLDDVIQQMSERHRSLIHEKKYTDAQRFNHAIEKLIETKQFLSHQAKVITRLEGHCVDLESQLAMTKDKLRWKTAQVEIMKENYTNEFNG